LLEHPREVAIVVGLTLGGTVAFYTYTIYMQKFLVNSAGFSKDTSTVIAAGTLFVYMCLQPVVGAISDRVGRRPVLLSFGILGTLLTVPILTTLEQVTNAWAAFFLIMGALVIVSGYTAINAVVKAELFPTSIRAMGVGFPYAVTVALFGGTAEWVALSLKDVGHARAFYWYVTGCIFVSLVVYALMRDTRDHSAMHRHV
jgi:MHS family alpha-ketoglutarate permease-like MFS transporter